ncbi:MAG: transcription-repair coupling factor, partial [Gammaproteobacteria bacterium]|nr:transcription-repair coupling factor [Gammaproteobacteria bacterium]
LIPDRRSITADAIKRLEAIESLEDLGAGFMLATHDLEIRGAGELLGDEQSGQIHEIGFTLYTELLERAVKALKSGKQPELDQPLDHGPEIDLHIPALLPEDYLPDVHTRLVTYKRIASAKNTDDLRELQVEMIDRFGLLPETAKTLIRITLLKLKASPLGISKINIGPSGGRVIIGDKPNLNTENIIQLIQTQPQHYKMDGQNKLRIVLDLEDHETRFMAVEKLLDTLNPE